MGKIKSDEETFHHVTDTLNCTAGESLFLDENELNVGAAERVWMKAVQVKGVKRRSQFKDLGKSVPY
jgi:FMN phosphatase YigB (HAD superfamily)